MNAAELLKEVTVRGVCLFPKGDVLRLRPRSALTPELVAELREQKTELLALLTGQREPRVAETLSGQVAGEQASQLAADVVALPLAETAFRRRRTAWDIEKLM